MLSLNDLCIVAYPLYVTSCALRSPQQVRKQKFVDISQMWYVVATVMCLDTLTLGLFPLVDTLKTALVMCACFSPTRKAAYDSSRYMVQYACRAGRPALQKVFEYAPFSRHLFERARDWCDRQTQTTTNVPIRIAL